MSTWENCRFWRTAANIYVRITILVKLPEAVATDSPALLQAHVLGSPLLHRHRLDPDGPVPPPCGLRGPVP